MVEMTWKGRASYIRVKTGEEGLCGDGQGEADCRSLTEFALDMELATAMGVDQVLDDAQSQAGSTQLPGSGPIDPIEALGDPREIR